MATAQHTGPREAQANAFKSIEKAVWPAAAIAAVVILLLPLPQDEKWQTIAVMMVSVAYVWGIFHYLIPRHGNRLQAHILASSGAIVVLTCANYLLAPYGVRFDLFFCLTIATTGMTSGLRPALFIALLATLSDAFTSFALFGHLPAAVLQVGLRAMAYWCTAYIVGSLHILVSNRTEQVVRNNRELAFLLDISTTTTSSLNMETILSTLAEKISVGLPVTLCRIFLLDRERHALVTRGAYALHALGDWVPATGESWPLQSMPQLRTAVNNAKTALLVAKEAPKVLEQEEQQLLFPPGIKVACFVPIIANGISLGAILVGESRELDREPFDQYKINVLGTLAAHVGIVVQNVHLHEGTQRQADRFAALVEIGRAIGSTLELDDLLELIHQQVCRAIPSDTYYVALYDQLAGMFDIRILVDDGVRYPRQNVAIGQGLATWVVLKRQPLLIRHMTAEWDDLPSEPIIMGQARLSESWLGVPMMTGDAILGLLVVASYEPFNLNHDDLGLLNAVAQQAALAIDNAYHHAQVEDQARHDSLTGVHNHGHFLHRLRGEITACADDHRPLSLIMLDIDHFKGYNDQYGHVVGDQVLQLIARTLRTHVGTTGLVGRWGGEEFAAALPGATAQEAGLVAGRLRESLSNACLTGTNGEDIPKPTVSQGIASFPLHAASAEDLIVLADRMLYRAKRAGRDRVKVAGDAESRSTTQ